MAPAFAVGSAAPAAASRDVQAAGDAARVAGALEPLQADQRRRVGVAVDEAAEVGQRPGDELDALVAVGVGLPHLGQAGGQEDVDLLVGEARAREVRRRVDPGVGLEARLLAQLALGGVDRVLALDVHQAGRAARGCRRGRSPRAAGGRGRPARRRRRRSPTASGASIHSRSRCWSPSPNEARCTPKRGPS
jgi:hypothetical protein